MARIRDYAGEYRRRVERGLARGLTLKAARGHGAPLARVRDRRQGLPFDTGLEAALKRLRKPGATLTEAARAERVSPERLRAYAGAVAGARWDGKAWRFDDQRLRQLEIVEAGVLDPVRLRVRGFEQAHIAGLHFHEASQAIGQPAKRAAFLRRWEGSRIRDDKGRWHELSTDFSQLLRAILQQDYSFEKFYSIEH